MKLPPRVFFTLIEAAARWGCAAADIAEWASIDKIEIVTSIPPVRCGVETVAGIIVVPVADMMAMFRRCGSGPAEYAIHRVRRPGETTWHYINEPADGLAVAMVDLMVMAGEARRFEEEHGLAQRSTVWRGASPYDWDAMYVAVIQRVHEHGLPESQGEFVAEFVDWFARRSETGEAPDESTIRRRLGPIWRALRG